MSAGGKLEEEVDGVRCHSHFQGIQSLWVQIIKRKLVASRRRFLTGRRLFSRGKLLFQRTFQQGKSLVSSRTRRWSRSRRRFLSVEKGAPVKVHVDDTVEKKVTVGASQAVMRAGDFWLDDMGYYGNVRCRKCGSCFLASIGSCGVCEEYVERRSYSSGVRPPYVHELTCRGERVGKGGKWPSVLLAGL